MATVWHVQPDLVWCDQKSVMLADVWVEKLKMFLYYSPWCPKPKLLLLHLLCN